MHSDRKVALLFSFGLLTALAGAQAVTSTNIVPANIGFVDISASGTAITGAFDDSSHTIFTTVGNTMFPAGIVRICNNGVAIAGVANGGVGFTNQPIPDSGPVSNVSAGGTGYVFPFWDDLVPNQAFTPSDTTIYWQEVLGVLFIMWKNETHFGNENDTEVVTFEVQVFSNPSSCGASIQYLYPDSVFGGGNAFADAGASATIGYAGGGTFTPFNNTWAFNSAGSVPTGTVVSFIYAAAGFVASSPSGPGSLRLQYGNSLCTLTGPTYYLAVTLHPGVWPYGWLFGVDIPFSELASELSIGAPFVGSGLAFTLGTFTGLPQITIYAVVLNFNAEGTLSGHSNPLSYTIP